MSRVLQSLHRVGLNAEELRQRHRTSGQGRHLGLARPPTRDFEGRLGVARGCAREQLPVSLWRDGRHPFTYERDTVGMITATTGGNRSHLRGSVSSDATTGRHGTTSVQSSQTSLMTTRGDRRPSPTASPRWLDTRRFRDAGVGIAEWISPPAEYDTEFGIPCTANAPDNNWTMLSVLKLPLGLRRQHPESRIHWELLGES